MSVGTEHFGSLTPEQAVRIQERLARRVRKKPSRTAIRRIAAADCCYSRDDTLCGAAVVVWDLESREEVETVTTRLDVHFPYIPGLFAFREAPAILTVLERLAARPQLLICNGHGIAHPRRFGLASHVGVLAGIPTVGCAQKRLCGSFVEPGAERGSSSPLTDGREIIGAVLRTRSGVRPLFISIGHRIDLATAVRIVLACTHGHRLPEPLRLAHLRAVEALHRGTGGLQQR
jgi:deoxyribonuclease V